MEDFELLKLAAKAGAIQMSATLFPDGSWSSACTQGFKPASGIGGGNCSAGWNPLDNDGDALRLATKLSITVMFMPEHDSVVAHACDNQFVEALDDFGTRRAIVRAAASIGESMP